MWPTCHVALCCFFSSILNYISIMYPFFSAVLWQSQIFAHLKQRSLLQRKLIRSSIFKYGLWKFHLKFKWQSQAADTSLPRRTQPLAAQCKRAKTESCTKTIHLYLEKLWSQLQQLKQPCGQMSAISFGLRIMNALALSINSPIVETHAKSKLVPCPVMRAGCKSLYFWIDNRASRNSRSVRNGSNYSKLIF